MTWVEFDEQLRAIHVLESRDHGGAPDCFYLCIKAAVEGLHAKNVNEIRNMVADHVYQHPPENIKSIVEVVLEIQPGILIVEDKQKADVQQIDEAILLNEYISWIKSNLFASDVEINAVCNLFKVCLRIYSLNEEENSVQVQEHGMEGDPIVLLCFHGNHYREAVQFVPRRRLVPHKLETLKSNCTASCALRMMTNDHKDAWGKENKNEVVCKKCSGNVMLLNECKVGVFCCQELDCLQVVCVKCVEEDSTGHMCTICENYFYHFCDNHLGKVALSRNICNSCCGVDTVGMLCGDDSISVFHQVKDMKRHSGQKYDLQRALSARSYNSLERSIVSFNVNGRSNTAGSSAGNSLRRKIVGEAFLAGCQADVILLQDSQWVVNAIGGHFKLEADARNYKNFGSKDASILVDMNTFTVEKQLDRSSSFASFVPTSDYRLADFGTVAHKIAAKGNFYMANILYVLERATFAQLRDIKTGHRIVVCSYHGPYRTSDQVCRECTAWVFELIIWFANGIDFILGGDFNLDIENLVPVLPTHNHDPRRDNNFDWILPSSMGLFVGPVNYAALFPLPPHNPAPPPALCLCPPNVFPDEEANIEVYWPWDINWKLLAQILIREGENVLFLNDVEDKYIFDHSPMCVKFLLVEKKNGPEI